MCTCRWDPPTWCGAAATLCAGDEETPSLVEKLRSEDGALVTERDGGSDLVLVTWWHLAFTCRNALVASARR